VTEATWPDPHAEDADVRALVDADGAGEVRDEPALGDAVQQRHKRARHEEHEDHDQRDLLHRFTTGT
jgi:hypothetical protein